MQNVKVDFRVLVSMLARAYSGEFVIAEAVAECLLYTTDDEVWDSLFVVMHDYEVHRIMIEEIVESLGFDIENFKEYALKTVNVNRFVMDRKKEDVTRLLNEILRWETGSQSYYIRVMNFDYSGIVERIGEEAVNKVKNTLERIIEQKGRNIKIIEEVFPEMLGTKNIEKLK